MQPLLQSDFDNLYKDPFKKFRSYVIKNIVKFRKESYDSNFFSIFNIAYFHVFFSFLFFLLPFLYFVFCINYAKNDYGTVYQAIIQKKNLKESDFLFIKENNNENDNDNKEIKGLIELFNFYGEKFVGNNTEIHVNNTNFIFKNFTLSSNFNKTKTFYSNYFNKEDTYSTKKIKRRIRDLQINFNFSLPEIDFNYINKFNFLEDFLFDFFLELQIKDSLNSFYYTTLLLITFLIGILFFKIIDCIYFLKLQSWRIKTITKTIKYLIWNISFLLMIIKFYNIFFNKEKFSEFFSKIKTDIFLSDSFNIKNYGISESIFFKILNKNSHKIFFYNLLFRIFFYFLFKFFLVNFLKFYFFLKIFFFIFFRNKYTLPYSVFYFFLFFLIFPNFNFFSFNKKEANDFLLFCWILIFFVSANLLKIFFYLKISLIFKLKKKEKKIKFGFFIILALGLIFLISFLIEIIKDGGIICKFFFNFLVFFDNKTEEIFMKFDLQVKLFLCFVFISFGLLENVGEIYLSLFYKDYLKEYFPIEKDEGDMIHYFVKKVVYHKFLKLGIYEWKK